MPQRASGLSSVPLPEPKETGPGGLESIRVTALLLDQQLAGFDEMGQHRRRCSLWVTRLDPPEHGLVLGDDAVEFAATADGRRTSREKRSRRWSTYSVRRRLSDISRMTAWKRRSYRISLRLC